MKKRVLYLVVLSSLLLTLSGCTSLFNKGEKVKPDEPLGSQVILKFQDVPVPANFKLQAQGSYSFQSSGLRVAVLKYKGRASLDQVVNFYKEQMPMHNWTLLNTMEYGDCLMNFDQDEESCIITVSPKGSNSIISISLGPKSKGVNRRSKQTLK